MTSTAGVQPFLPPPPPPHALRKMPGQDLGASQLQTSISSLATEEIGGGRDGDKEGDRRGPGARWIPWEEGGESCSPPGARAPGSDFNLG